MSYKKLLLIFISVLLCLSFVSCGLLFPKEESSETDTELSSESEAETVGDGDTESAPKDTESDTEAAPAYISLYEGSSGAKIIYGMDADSSVMQLANGLANSLRKMGVAEHKVTTARSEYDAEAVEIVVGRTDYAESKQVYSSIGYGEAKACVVGNKVVLAAFDIEGLERAIELFKYEINDCKDENGGLRVLSDYAEGEVTNQAMKELPVLSGATPTAIIDSGDGSHTLSFEDLSETLFDAYLNEVTEEGFELYCKNTIEKNDFYTYFKGDKMLYALYLENLKAAKIIISQKTNTDMSVLKTDTSYVKGDKAVLLTQLGLTYAADHEKDSGTKHPEAEYYTSGMSYIIRLDDGSFIVVDGGYDKQGDADRLYETMKKQSGSEQITVAAWVFSHMHSDHVEFFPKFASTYADKVTIERFIYNVPGKGQINGHSDSFSKIRPILNQYYSDTPKIKAVAGQKFYIRSVEIEILYSFDISRNVLKNYNNSSLVFTLKAEGKQVMFMGDYSETTPVLNKIYTVQTLKSDVMQVAHHGISDGNNALNRAIAPDYALWPVSGLQIRTEWEKNPVKINLESYGFNSYFVNMDQSRVFVSGDDVLVMNLSGDISTALYDNFDAYLGGVTK